MIGQTISHYNITAKLGAGGMGEVYLAEDTSLHRKVALKFMPEAMAQDAEARTRFAREAQATAALNHPNIVTVYEVAEHERRPYIVMEYVPGKTLDQYLDKHKLQHGQILEIAQGIASGLERAHREGIVHRDLKPVNIMVDEDGRPRILDFGLAKVLGATKLTQTDSTLGTVSYMSPEQALSQDIDQRSDVFSFGAIVYEMFAGRPPFHGDNEAAIVYSIVNELPQPMARFHSNLPDGLQSVIDKALQKDRSLRYQSAADLSADLRRVQMTISSRGLSQPITPAKPRRTPWVITAVAATIVIAALVVWFWFIPKPPPMPATMAVRQLTYYGDVVSCQISPNGDQIAYTRGEPGKPMRLYVQDIDGGEPLQVYQERVISSISWNPDGSQILVTAGRDSVLYTLLFPRLGGNPRHYPGWSWVSAWQPSGAKFCLPQIDGSLMMIDRDTGDTSSIHIRGVTGLIPYLEYSPDGERLALSAASSGGFDLWTCESNGTHASNAGVDLTIGPHWSRDGKAVYCFRAHAPFGDIVRIDIDPQTGKAQGEPAVLVSGAESNGLMSVSADSRRLVYGRRASPSNLWEVTFPDAAGSNRKASVRQITHGTAQISSAAVSPDGSQVVFASVAGEQNQIFVYRLKDGVRKQLTYSDGIHVFPVWSPDGRQIACGVHLHDTTHVVIVDADNGHETTLGSTQVSIINTGMAWAPGREILYNRGGDRVLVTLDPATGHESELLHPGKTEFNFSFVWSPDQTRIVYQHGVFAAGATQVSGAVVSIRIQTPGDTTFTYLRTDDTPLSWSKDGKWLYLSSKPASDTTSIVRMHADGSNRQVIVTLPWATVQEIALLPEGTGAIVVVPETKTDVCLIENFDSRMR